MKQKFSSTVKVFLALMVFLPSLTALADNEFDRAMLSYSASQKVALKMTKKKDVFKFGEKSASFRKGKLSWSDHLNNDIEAASRHRINDARNKMLGDMIMRLNTQVNNNVGELDNAILDIMQEVLAQEEDLVYQIAICASLRSFVTNNKNLFKRNDAVRLAAFENLDDAEKTIIENIQKRFEDEDLKELVNEYKKLYPDEELTFSSTAPAHFTKVMELFNQNIKSFENLNRNSAIAEFRLWGKDMLNVLILNNNPVLVKEFKLQLNNHKKAFR